jgi:hypothetical protein
MARQLFTKKVSSESKIATVNGELHNAHPAQNVYTLASAWEIFIGFKNWRKLPSRYRMWVKIDHICFQTPVGIESFIHRIDKAKECGVCTLGACDTCPCIGRQSCWIWNPSRLRCNRLRFWYGFGKRGFCKDFQPWFLRLFGILSLLLFGKHWKRKGDFSDQNPVIMLVGPRFLLKSETSKWMIQRIMSRDPYGRNASKWWDIGKPSISFSVFEKVFHRCFIYGRFERPCSNVTLTQNMDCGPIPAPLWTTITSRKSILSLHLFFVFWKLRHRLQHHPRSWKQIVCVDQLCLKEDRISFRAIGMWSPRSSQKFDNSGCAAMR